MRRIYLLLVFIKMITNTFGQPFIEQSAITTNEDYSSIAWGDYDNDGDLDLFAAKMGADITVFKNNFPSNNFTPIIITENNFQSGGEGIKVGDFNNDGNIDIFVYGVWTENNVSVPTAILLINSGAPYFYFLGSYPTIPIKYGGADFGDYDNDGDLDILIAGKTYGYPNDINVCKIYKNNYPESGFTEQNITLPGLIYANVKWIDYDNDGDLDAFLTGNNSGAYSRIFINNYPQNSFTEDLNLSLPNIVQAIFDWGDYDNDGDWDLLIYGTISGNIKILKLYSNLFPHHDFEEKVNFTLPWVYNLDWGDFDHDGDIDILWTGSPDPDVRVLQNDFPEINFTEILGYNTPSTYGSFSKWGDYDNDGDLDFVVYNPIRIYRNEGNNINSTPSYPDNLEYDGNVFSWEKSTDDVTPQNTLTYNLRIGIPSNRDTVLASLSYPLTGYRKVTDHGNLLFQNSFDYSSDNFIQLGEYVWSVQAIDQAYAGSDFAPEQSFIIGALIDPRETQNINAGEDGIQMTVSEYQTSSSREWKVRSLYDEEYESLSPIQNGISYTPNFIYGQSYYIICESTQNGVTYTSNKVRVNVEPFHDDVAVNRIEYYHNVTPNPENPENLIMPGKKIRFKLRAENNYTQNLLTLKGYIRTNSPYVTIIDSIGSFNNILMGQQGWTSDFYEIEVSPDLPSTSEIIFLLNMRDEIVTSVTWNSQFSVPFLQVSDVYFDDDNYMDSQGNNDKTVQSGETIEILPLVSNTSLSDLYTISGLLTSSTSGVAIWNNHIGVNTLVMDHYTYNIESNGYITNGSKNIHPDQDYVFEYSGLNSNDLNFNLLLEGYAYEPQGSSWDNGGVLMKFGAPFILENGQSQSEEMAYISSSPDAVKFDRMEFYQNVSASSENPANLIGPGNKVRFKLRVENNFKENLPALKATISSNSEKVTITDSLATLNNVDKDAKIWTTDEFEIQIDEDLTGVGEIEFTLTVNDNIINAGPWNSIFSIPVPNVMAVVIDDDANPDSNGNDNDIAEPGETIEIIPLLANFSSDTLFSVFGHLSSFASYIQIWDNIQGSTNMVYDTYPYNSAGGNQTPILPNATYVQPEQDFVFNHNGAGVYSLNFNVYLWGYVGADQGANWDEGGVLMKWNSPFIMNQGQPSEPLTIFIYNPADGSYVTKGSDIEIFTLPIATQSDIDKVDFFVDGQLKGTDETNPYSYIWNTTGYEIGLHTVKAVVTDNNQLTAYHQIEINLIEAVNVELNGSFSFTLDETIFEAIPPENRVFTVTLQDGSQLPSWLSFEENTLTFSGIAPITPGNYIIKVLVTSNGKTEILYEFMISVGDIQTLIEAKDISGLISVFPNPVEDIITIKSPINDYYGLKYRFYSSSGKLLMDDKISEEEMKISLNNLPAGIYFLAIMKENEPIKSIKVFKQ